MEDLYLSEIHTPIKNKKQINDLQSSSSQQQHTIRKQQFRIIQLEDQFNVLQNNFQKQNYQLLQEQSFNKKLKEEVKYYLNINKQKDKKKIFEQNDRKVQREAFQRQIKQILFVLSETIQQQNIQILTKFYKNSQQLFESYDIQVSLPQKQNIMQAISFGNIYEEKLRNLEIEVKTLQETVKIKDSIIKDQDVQIKNILLKSTKGETLKNTLNLSNFSQSIIINDSDSEMQQKAYALLQSFQDIKEESKEETENQESLQKQSQKERKNSNIMTKEVVSIAIQAQKPLQSKSSNMLRSQNFTINTFSIYQGLDQLKIQSQKTQEYLSNQVTKTQELDQLNSMLIHSEREIIKLKQKIQNLEDLLEEKTDQIQTLINQQKSN